MNYFLRVFGTNTWSGILCLFLVLGGITMGWDKMTDQNKLWLVPLLLVLPGTLLGLTQFASNVITTDVRNALAKAKSGFIAGEIAVAVFLAAAILVVLWPLTVVLFILLCIRIMTAPPVSPTMSDELKREPRHSVDPEEMEYMHRLHVALDIQERTQHHD